MSAFVRSLAVVVTHVHHPVALFVGLVGALFATKSKLIVRGEGWLCSRLAGCFAGHLFVESLKVFNIPGTTIHKEPCVLSLSFLIFFCVQKLSSFENLKNELRLNQVNYCTQ